MPVEMFLKMDGVTGESRNFQFKGWADISRWDWSLSSNRESVRPVEGEEIGFNSITLTKRIGRDSTAMMRFFAERKIVPNAELCVTPVVGKREARQKYLHLFMEDVIIKSIVTGGANQEDLFNETVTLLFNRIRFEYNQHDSLQPGTAAEDHVFSWDIGANRPIEPDR